MPFWRLISVLGGANKIPGIVSRVKRILGTALVLLAVSACDAGGGGSAATSFAPGCDNEIVTCMEQRSTPPPTVIDPSKK